MLLLDAALVSAEKPPLEKRGDSVNPRHDFVGWIQTVADDGDLVLVASAPARNTRAIRRCGLPTPASRRSAQGEKAIRRHILDAPKADPADGPTALLERPWIIDSRNGVARNLHRIFIPPKLAGVKGISNFGHMVVRFVRLDRPEMIRFWRI